MELSYTVRHCLVGNSLATLGTLDVQKSDAKGCKGLLARRRANQSDANQMQFEVAELMGVERRCIYCACTVEWHFVTELNGTNDSQCC